MITNFDDFCLACERGRATASLRLTAHAATFAAPGGSHPCAPVMHGEDRPAEVSSSTLVAVRSFALAEVELPAGVATPPSRPAGPRTKAWFKTGRSSLTV